MATTPLLSTVRHEKVPCNYIRPVSQRPRLTEVITDADIPVVDLACPDRATLVSQVQEACRSYGFFKVVNHGIPEELLAAVMAVTWDFFRLPAEEKAKLYSDDPEKKARLSTSFNVRKEAVHNWRDYLRLHCYPLQDFLPLWPAKPPSFKSNLHATCTEIRRLGFRLYGVISESLGLEERYIETALGGQEQQMAVNYYPPCPSPDLTLGLPAHTDPNVLTVLLADHHVAGLQILKDGSWIAVRPQPNTLVVNIGDQKSVWHRAVVNADRARMSVASFLCPRSDVLLGPAPELVVRGGAPPAYRKYRYEEYYKMFWSRNLDQQTSCLDFFKYQA